MTTSDVSVVIPVYNGERYLAEAVESVLIQEPRPAEVILVDDGSTDDSAAVAARFGRRIRYERQSNAGQSAARNRGVSLARGSLLAFLDDDDYWAPGKLGLQLEALDADPTLEAVFGHVRQFVSPELPADIACKVRYHAEVMPGHIPGAMLIRRGAFERVGPFDPQWQVGEFIQWYARAVEVNLRTTMLPDVVLHRRLHDDNQGIRQRAESIQYVRILKAALDRRRSSGTAP
jgi:glycosyltransferase involved in cell wall biosynthesis